jgi:hypothetical protein
MEARYTAGQWHTGTAVAKHKSRTAPGHCEHLTNIRSRPAGPLFVARSGLLGAPVVVSAPELRHGDGSDWFDVPRQSEHGASELSRTADLLMLPGKRVCRP